MRDQRRSENLALDLSHCYSIIGQRLKTAILLDEEIFVVG